MSPEDTFESMLAALHEAAFDDARWPAASALIDRVCGSRGSVLVFGDGVSTDDVDIFFARVCFGGQRHPECERDYFGFYHAHDERLPRLRQLPHGQVVSSASLLTEEERKTSMVYNELLRPSEFGDTLCVRLDGPHRSRIVWSSADPVSGDGWSSAQVETVERVLPHLRQYVRVRQTLAGARALGASLGELLVNVGFGVVQLDRRGRVVAANDRARAILRAGDGLTDRDGTLRAALPNEDADLQRTLARALPANGRTGESGSVLVSREHSPVRLVLHAIPVNGEGAEPHLGREGALVLVVDPESRWRIDAGRLGAILGLTTAESRIAAMMAEGMTIRDIATVTARRETTVKWHVRHVFSKLGVSRQADLVRLVLSVSDFPEPPHPEEPSAPPLPDRR